VHIGNINPDQHLNQEPKIRRAINSDTSA